MGRSKRRRRRTSSKRVSTTTKANEIPGSRNYDLRTAMLLYSTPHSRAQQQRVRADEQLGVRLALLETRDSKRRIFLFLAVSSVSLETSRIEVLPLGAGPDILTVPPVMSVPPAVLRNRRELIACTR